MKYASLRQGLVGAWCPSLGPSGNTLLDRSGYGNHGTLTNMDAGTDWVASRYGGALDFDGVNDHVVIGDVLNSVFVGASAKFTLSAWVYPTSTGNLAVFAKNADSNFLEDQRQFVLRVNNLKLTFVWFGALLATDFRLIESNASIPINQWSHVAVTFDATVSNPDNKAAFAINGISAPHTLILSTGSPVSIQNGTARLALGAFSGSSGSAFFQPFSGQLNDLRIYSSVIDNHRSFLLASEPGIGLKPERTSVFFGSTSNRRRRILTGMA